MQTLKYMYPLSILNSEAILCHQQIEDFVSDIGGQLGLWIGFSVLTAAEFLELIMLMCHLIIKKCSTKKSPEPNHVPQLI